MGDLGTLAEHLDAITGEPLIVLPYRGRDYPVYAAETSRGLRCSAWVAAGSIEDGKDRSAERTRVLQAQEAWERRRAGRIQDDAARADRLAVLDALGGATLQLLALGIDGAEQLDTDGVPAGDAYILAMTAVVAHAQGAGAARRYAARLAARRAGEDTPSGEASPRPQPSKSGRGTASGSRTRKATSRATTTRKS